MKMKMKMFLTVILMLMMICLLVVPMLKVKKTEGVCAVVVMGETLGKPIVDKSTYKFITDGIYMKVVDDKMLFSCTEVDGKIASMELTLHKIYDYNDAMSVTLKMMAEYADEYNNGIYFGYSKESFVTRYKGNNIITAVVEPAAGYWQTTFTYQKLNKEGSDYIKYKPEYEQE